MDQSQSNATKPKVEQRASRRQKPKGCVKVVAYRNKLGLGANIAQTILDVSETGVRLVLKQALPVGQEFEITLDSAGSNAVKVLGQVIWSIKAEDGTFVTGAKFQTPISYLELHKLATI